MSPHRLDYVDLQRPPITGRRRSLDAGTLLAVAVVLAFAGLLALHTLASMAVEPASRATFSSPSAAVEDARIEGFRAGMAAALDQGCRTPVLQAPIARP